MSARNVYNAPSVAAFVESHAERAPAPVAPWLRTTVRRWILKHHGAAVPVALGPDGAAYAAPGPGGPRELLSAPLT